MNIDPLSSSGFLYQTRVNGRSSGQGPASTNGSPAESEHLSTELSAKVRASLEAMPEVRPEVVERGRQLLDDPNYPSPDIVRKIAQLITPLSEE